MSSRRKRRFGLQTANQQSIKSEICGPARIKVAGFRAIHGEVLFIDMQSEDDEYQPRIGYVPLKQCGAAVDLIGRRLIPVGYMDLKSLILDRRRTDPGGLKSGAPDL